MSYKVEIDIFEGPYDLLVYLIENAEMSIYDIQIGEITDKYIEYLEKMKQLKVDVATEFILLSATLLHIKSKMLLPNKKIEGSVSLEEDPREELVEKLVEYTKYKKMAEILAEKEEKASLRFTKPQEDLSEYTKETDEYLKLDMAGFVKAFDFFLKKKQRVEEVRKNYTKVRKNRETIENKISEVIELFKNRNFSKLFFRELVDSDNQKEDSVLTFTAILQMMKNKLIVAKQKENFSEIEIEILDEVK